MSDIMSHYGGSILGMIGKDCVAIATDRRVGSGYQTIAVNYPKISQPNPNCLIGIAGFAPDAQIFHKDIQAECDFFRLENGRDLSPNELINLISAILYEHRFGPLFVSPIVVGLEHEDGTIKPVCGGHDSIGAPALNDWISDGTAAYFLMGPAEKFWKKDMSEEELVDCCSRTFSAGVNRDAYSGWGIDVWVLRANGEILKKEVACRMD